jgi:processive 1,2-diacylglycerol beta-glucosyltransferase
MRRIVIVSASLGAGHDSAARALADRLTAAGNAVSCHDFLDLLPGRLGTAVRSVYRRQLAVAPGSWDWLLTRVERHRWCANLVTLLALSAGRGLRRAVGHPDAVLCTYPLAAQVAVRRLTVPVGVYPTDPAVHPLWIVPGAAFYLAAHDGIAEQLRALGARRVVVVDPLVRRGFRPPAGPAERAGARARFGLPADAVLALVMSGSWAVGDIAASARDIAAAGAAVPVVVCGDNTALRGQLSGLPGVVLGWVDDMPELMRACDVAVLNSGGTSFFEAQATGLPVVHYRCLPGHARGNAAALAAAGLAWWARDRAALTEALTRITRAPAPTGTRCPAAAVTALLDGPAAPRPRRRTLPRRLAAAALVVSALLWLFTTGTSLAVAHGLDSVAAARHRTSPVHLVVEATPTDPAALRELVGLHAAVAVSLATARTDPALVGRLSAAGLEVVNAAGGPPYRTGWIDGRGAIGADASTLTALTGRAPRWLLSDGDLDAVDVSTALRYGERVVIPSTVLDCTGAPPRPARGGIVLLRTTPGCDLDAALGALARQGLRTAPLSAVSA